MNIKRSLIKLVSELFRRLGYDLVKRRVRQSEFDQLEVGFPLKTSIEMTDGMTSFRVAEMLYELARTVEAGCIVEVGSYRGRSAVALGRGSLDGFRVPVFAIDPHDDFLSVKGVQFGPADRGAFYKAMLETRCFHIVRLINLPSLTAAKCWDRPIGLLFLDGDHSYEGVRKDFLSWKKFLANDSIVALDDTSRPDLGPYRLANELLESGEFVLLERLGGVTVLRHREGCSNC